MRKIYSFFYLGLTLLLLLGVTGLNAQVVSVESNSTQCYDDTDGSIVVHLDQGVTITGLLVNGVSETPFVSGSSVYILDLPAGTYNLVLSFAAYPDYSTTIDVDEPDPLYFVLTHEYDCGNSLVAEICAVDANGTSVNVGGTPPYDFYWLDNSNFSFDTMLAINSLPCINSAVAPNFMPVNMLNYTGDVELYVYDNNDCFFSQSKILTPPTITFDVAVTDAVCLPAASGIIDVTNVTGGIPPYTYEWSTGATTTVPQLTDLLPGTYTVTVLDSYQCASASMSAEIVNPNGLIMDATTVDASCNGGSDGSISTVVSGGTGQTFFNWSNLQVGLGLNTISNLTPGTYCVTATDVSTSCNVTECFTIDEPDPLTIIGQIDHVTCNGSCDGSVEALATGGTPGSYGTTGWEYQYRLFTNATSTYSAWQTSTLFSNICAGTYSIEVQDANNCISAYPNFSVTEPNALTITLVNQNNVSCYMAADGSLDLSVAGGTAPYSYIWSNQEVTEDLSNLGPGQYCITVTDINGCSATECFTITEPNELYIAWTSGDVTCYGISDGFIDITVDGGTMPYTFAWTLNGAAFASTEDLTGIGPGDYCLTAIDANGCTFTFCQTITEPNPLTIYGQVEHVSCNGYCNGSVAAIATGGTPSYQYRLYTSSTGTFTAWQTATLFSSLCPDTYSLEVMDANGCISSYPNFDITEPAMLTMTLVNQSNVSCYMAMDGSLDISVAGGTAPYVYQWNNQEVTEDLSNLGPGTYCVTITDLNGCSVTDCFTITEPQALNATHTFNDVTCFGFSDGNIDVSVFGGTTPYSFTWTLDGAAFASTEDLTNIGPGNYCLSIVDANGCSFTFCQEIFEPTPLTINGQVEHVSCFDYCDGSVDAIATGGTPGYEYRLFTNSTATYTAWQTSTFFDNMCAGVYSLEVRDANGCVSAYPDFNINQPDLLEMTLVDLTNVSCYMAMDGSIDIAITGGTAPYTYTWNNQANTEDLSNLGPGTYCVTITDFHGCSVNDCFTITEPYMLNAYHSYTDVTCFGFSDGSIDVTVDGGTMPYTFAWTLNGAVFSADEDLTNIGPGNYCLSIVDANGCTFTFCQEIFEPTPLTILGQVEHVTCNGYCDGSVEALATGGTPGYQYRLFTSSTATYSAWQTATLFTNLCPDVYSLEVMDANGCVSAYPNFSITEPQLLTLTLVDLSYVSCNGAMDGSIDISIAGGTTPYTYTWNNQVNTEDLSNLGPGTYCVTVTDAHGCSLSECFTVTQPNTLVASYTYLDVTCFGFSDGSIDVTAVGGTTPYTYAWTLNGAVFSSDEDLTNIGPGNYCLTIVDANGCTFTFCQDIFEPTPLTILGQVEHVSCNGYCDGSVDAVATGGTPGYQYRLFTSSTATYSSWQTATSFTGLCPDVYSLEVMDANGCISAYPNFSITEPQQLTLTLVDLTNVSCYMAMDGSIDISIAGGTTPYTYTWNNQVNTEDLSNLGPGTYCVTVTDAHGCSLNECFTITEPNELLASYTYLDVTCFGFSDGAIDVTVDGGTMPYTFAWTLNGAVFSSDEDLTNIGPGDYCLTIVDANGCTFTLCQNIFEPTPLTIDGQVEHVSCNGYCDGSVQVSATGGTPGYEFRLFYGSTATYTAWQTGLLFDNLCPDSYSVEVRDANGCISAYPTFTITEPPLLEMSLVNLTNVSCYMAMDGNIDIAVTGGTTPYTFTWSNQETTEDLSNLGPGTYCVTITDAHGCQVNDCFSITEPMELSAYNYYGDVTCYGFSDAWIDVSVFGGTTPYTFAWTLNGAAFSIDEDLTAIGPGDYCLTITDANGCTFNLCQTIFEPTPLTINGQVEQVTCYGFCDGSVDASATGGTPPYQYRLYTGSTGTYSAWQTPTLFDNLCPNSYSIEVMDANGCVSAYPVFTITEPDLLVSTLSVDDLLCLNGNGGAIDLTVVGGTLPYSYSWSNGETTEDIDTLVGGEYCVTVTDANGCTNILCDTVHQPIDPLNALYITGENVSCFGFDDGWFEVIGTGGQSPYQYSLDYSPYTVFMDTPMVYTGLTPGFHLLTIGDSNNCEVLYEVEITEPTEMTATFDMGHVNCYGENGGWIDVTVSGGTFVHVLPTGTVDTIGYDFIWSNGATTEDISNLTAGAYTVTITDLNGCMIIETINIVEPPVIVLSYDSENLNCYGQGSGWIDLTVAGGVPPYTYAWNNGEVTEDLADLSGGWYSVTVTDAHGCVAVTTVLITEPAPTLLNFDVTDIMCTGTNDGAIDLLLPSESCIVYQWSNGANTQDISGLAAGWYSVTVIDCNGCVAIDSACVYAPNNPLEIAYSVNDVLCYGGNTGSIDISAIGGTMPYVGIQWTGVIPTQCCGLDTIVQDSIQFWGLGQTTDMIENLEAGTYYVTLTDVFGCEAYAEINVDQPPCPLTISNYLVTDVDLGVPGSIDIYICCGTFPYTYYWEYEGDFYSTSEDVLDGPAGTYNVTVTDANGCQTEGEFVVGSHTYPPWSNIVSESSHTIYIPSSAVPSLSIGDYIGVFYDSLGTMTCGGFIKWEGNSTTLAAWGDDGIDPSNQTGFLDGEEFTWVIWDAATEVEYFSTPSYDLTFPNDSTYTVNGISGLSSLTPGAMIDAQDIVLNETWNLISTYIDPFYPNVEDVFAPVLSELIIVKNGDGNVYWPQFNVNTIGNMVIGEGYKVKMTNTLMLTVEGIQVVPELTPFTIPQEWSIIGYLRTSPAAIETLLSPIVSDVIIVKNEVGNVYWPSMFNLNTIGNMVPGKGYHIKMAQSASYTYPANGMLGQSAKSLIDLNTKHFNNNLNTGSNMTIGIPASAWTTAPMEGDEIAVLNSNGDVIGASVYNANAMSITVWGDDAVTNLIEGITNGEDFTFSIWHKSINQTETLVVDSWSEGEGVYSDNAIAVVGKFSATELAAYALYQNMPNPFSTTTQISFEIPQDTYVTVGVYNLLGELLEEVASQNMVAGKYTIDFNAANLPSGTYLYKIITDEFVATKQMNVIK